MSLTINHQTNDISATSGSVTIGGAAVGAGGEQTFTASGSISAGNIVGINSSGTVEVLGVQDSGVVQVSSIDPYQRDYSRIGAASNGSDKVAIAISRQNATPVAYVGTLSGASISWGSGVNITSGTDRYVSKVVYDANAGKFLYAYQDATLGGLHAKVGTVSGTSISFGSELAIDSSGYEFDMEYNPDTQSTLFFYLTTNQRLYAKVLTISGTSVSAGSTLTVESGANFNYPYLSYDTTANKYLGVYSDAGSSRGQARVFTVSGTSVTMGSGVAFNSGATAFYPKSSYNPVANRHAISYYSNGVGAFAVAATISGTSVTLGSEIQFPVTFFGGSDYNPVLQQSQFSSYGYAYYYTAIFGSGNDLSLSATSTVWLNSDKTPSNAAARFVNIDSNRNFWVWENTNLPYSQVLNENMPRFVGLAAENISDGATGKVTTVGGINTNVSGLTAGKSYGILPTGSTISEILPQGGDAKSIFGTALSSTSIFMDKGNLR